MKFTLIILLLLSKLLHANGLGINDKHSVKGFYGSIVFLPIRNLPSGASHREDNWSYCATGKVGWKLADRIGVGWGVNLSLNNQREDFYNPGYGSIPEIVTVIGYNYGGLVLSYLDNKSKLGLLQFDMLIGGGRLQHYDMDFSLSGPRHPKGEADDFFVMEPSMNLSPKLIGIISGQLGIGYRFAAGLSKYGRNSNDISGVTFALGFRFGK